MRTLDSDNLTRIILTPVLKTHGNAHGIAQTLRETIGYSESKTRRLCLLAPEPLDVYLAGCVGYYFGLLSQGARDNFVSIWPEEDSGPLSPEAVGALQELLPVIIASRITVENLARIRRVSEIIKSVSQGRRLLISTLQDEVPDGHEELVVCVPPHKMQPA